MIDNFDGIVAIVSNKTKFLLIKNKHTGNITFPAGAKKKGELELDALKRELFEETGLEPKDYIIIPTNVVYEFIYNQKRLKDLDKKQGRPFT